VLAFIERNDEILFIKRLKEDAFAYQKLNGVGGHIEQGEDPLTAIRREVQEECGLFIREFTLHAVIFIDIECNPGINVFVFSAIYPGGEVQPSDEGDLVWVKKEDVHKQNVIKDVPMLLKTIEDSKKDGRIQYLQYIYEEKELAIKHIS
jgi:8-oxo-dGTP diphosphatase